MLNGTAFVIAEIERLSRDMNRISNWSDKNLLLINYANLNVGEGDKVRLELERRYGKDAHIVIGKRTMDLSGTANIVFGYYMADLGYHRRIEDGVADLFQFKRSLSEPPVRLTDMPDDFTQRRTGRALREKGLLTPTLKFFEDIAEEQGLE